MCVPQGKIAKIKDTKVVFSSIRIFCKQLTQFESNWNWNWNGTKRNELKRNESNCSTKWIAQAAVKSFQKAKAIDDNLSQFRLYQIPSPFFYYLGTLDSRFYVSSASTVESKSKYRVRRFEMGMLFFPIWSEVWVHHLKSDLRMAGIF